MRFAMRIALCAAMAVLIPLAGRAQTAQPSISSIAVIPGMTVNGVTTTDAGIVLTLNVYGTGFTAGSTITWTGAGLAAQGLTPTILTSTMMAATVPANLVTPGVATVGASVPPAGGGAPTVLSGGTVNVNPALTAAPPGPYVGTAFAPFSLALMSGGTPPYFASITSGALPSGVFLGQDATISGFPDTPGTYQFNFFGGDATSGASVSPSTPFTVVIAPAVMINSAVPPNGIAGRPYPPAPFAFTATGGNPPYTWGLSGGDGAVVPPWLTINQATGALSSTGPVTQGTYLVGVFATDSVGAVASFFFPLTIDPPLGVSPATLPDGAYQVPYEGSAGLVLTGQGGSAQGGYTLSFLTALPAGMSFDPARSILGGTPTTAGLFPLTLRVSDSLGRSADVPLSLRITAPALSITSGSPLPFAMAGRAFTATFSGTGGVPPLKWAMSSGGLPAGFTLDANTGALSGTPSAAGTYNFAVRLRDASSPAQSITGNFSLIVDPALGITPDYLPPAVEGTPYSQAISGTGGRGGGYFITASGLPTGLSFNSSVATNSPINAITGTTKMIGTFSVTFHVMDSYERSADIVRELRVDPAVQPLTITTATLPDGTYFQSYNTAVLASGGEEPYTFTATGLPRGLSVSTIGAIYGRPEEVGTFTVTVTVKDKGDRTDSKTYSLKLIAPPLTITTASPLAGNVGSPVSITLAATGGVPPYTWATSAAAPGLSLAGGVLSGTPSEPGTFTFTAQVRDSKGTLTSKDLSIAVTALPLTLEASLPSGRVGDAYSAGFAAHGGVPPYRWSISGLPAGLTADGGTIAGNPAAAGKSTVTATVTDAKGSQASTTVELIVIAATLRIDTASLPNGTVGVAYSASLAASGGAPPYQWSIVAGYAGALGVSGGVVSGVPAEVGTFDFFVQVTDSDGAKASKGFSVTVDRPGLTVTTTLLPAGTVGAAYSAAVSATGGSGDLRWSAAGLPAGLSMNASGSITGTPSSPGSASVTVTAVDAAGRTASKTLTLAVGLPPLPTPSFMGVPDTSQPATQFPVGLGLDGSYPLAISGTVTLTFASDANGVDDPAIQFSNGGRTVDFTIPAGANLATFTIPNLALQTGTVAGTVTMTATLSAMGQAITPTPVRTVRINPMPPVITRVTVARSATGFDVTVVGYANTRDVGQAIFHFTPATGVTVQTSDVTMPVDALFSKWYQDSASRAYGSQFLFTQPFTLTGDAGSIASVTVTLVSSAGRSSAVSANVP